jgi:hypothetical protein
MYSKKYFARSNEFWRNKRAVLQFELRVKQQKGPVDDSRQNRPSFARCWTNYES